MNGIRCHKQNDSPNRNDLSSFLKVVNDVEVERRAGCKLFHARGPATANARSPMDARRVDGTPDRRLTLNGADDVQHWRQTLSGQTSILALLHSGSRALAHTTYTGCVVVPAASVSPSGGVSLCGIRWRHNRAPNLEPRFLVNFVPV